MKVTIEIDCDSVAFEESVSAEVSRILQDLASYVAMTDMNEPFDRLFTLRDLNGNKVGLFESRDSTFHAVRSLRE